MRKQIEEFDKTVDNFVSMDSERLSILISSEIKYAADPYYFEKNQS